MGDVFVKLNIGNMNPVAFEPQKIEKETKVQKWYIPKQMNWDLIYQIIIINNSLANLHLL